jgi:hypothetical protein
MVSSEVVAIFIESVRTRIQIPCFHQQSRGSLIWKSLAGSCWFLALLSDLSLYDMMILEICRILDREGARLTLVVAEGARAPAL